MAGVELEYWVGPKFDSKGNYGSTMQKIRVEDVDAKAVAEILRSAARDLERGAGLRE